MPLNRKTTRTFHTKLYATELESIWLQKRGDDQLEGRVVTYQLFQCRRSRISKLGEPILGDMSSADRTVWHIPRIELDRVGVNYIDPLDIIIDQNGRKWQAESDTGIEEKLFSNHYCILCKRLK